MKNSKLAAISQRVIYVAAFAGFLICSGFIYLENLEFQKVIKPSDTVYASMLLGYFLAIVAANYFLASRGDNWTNVTAELCLVLSSWFSILATLGPNMFKITTGSVPAPKWNPFASDSPILGPNNDLQLLYIPAILFLIIAVWKIVRHKEEI